jgi:uncharacterized protein DUF6962
MSGPPGFTIHDPDVVLTDLALAVLGTWLAWRLARAPAGRTMARSGVLVMAALASAAFWGAVFHGFFPAGTTTRAGFMAWMPVAVSIAVIGMALLTLALRVAAPRVTAATRRVIAAVYGAAFVLTVLLVDESYGTIILFYAPVVVLFLLVATREAVRTRNRGWTLLAASFALSLLAAALQQARVSIHPQHFDHNAVYHVLQGIALVLLYRGFLRAPAIP